MREDMEFDSQKSHGSDRELGGTSRRSSTCSASPATFSQRIVYADSYTAIPIPAVDLVYSEFRGSVISRVPVIRIFGATPRGQKTCTHIHGVFPYLYIQCNESLHEHQLAISLDKCINSALSGNGSGNGTQHVYKILRVQGRSFYGYKQQEDVFLKIYFYNYWSLKKAEDLLHAGSVLGKQFQPFESHIPFTLQFFMDYKLYGMNFIHFRDIKFRKPEQVSANHLGELELERSAADCMPALVPGILSQKLWNISEIPEDLFLPSNVSRRSRCELEIDVLAKDVIVSESSRGKNPGIEAIWMDERERRRLRQIDDWSNLTIPSSQERNSTDFVFPRERQLTIELQSNLESRESHLMEAGDNLDRPPIQTQHSQFFSPNSSYTTRHPAASQSILNDSIENIPDGLLNDEIEMNEEDREILALLEDMGRDKNRERIEEESDSIIPSQFAHSYIDCSSDEDNEGAVDPNENKQSSPEGSASSNEEILKWSQEYMTPEMFAEIEELERIASEESVVNSDPRNETSPFKISQCDGQFDDSSSASSEASTSKSKLRSLKKIKRRKLQLEFDREEFPTPLKNLKVDSDLPVVLLSRLPEVSPPAPPASQPSRSLRKRPNGKQIVESKKQKKGASLSCASFATSPSCHWNSSLPKTDQISVLETDSDSEIEILESPLKRPSPEIVTIESESPSSVGIPEVFTENKSKPQQQPEVIVIAESSESESSTASETEFSNEIILKKSGLSNEPAATVVHAENFSCVHDIDKLTSDNPAPSSQVSIADEEEFEPDQSLGITSFYEYSQSQTFSNEDEVLEDVENCDNFVNSVYEYSEGTEGDSSSTVMHDSDLDEGGTQVEDSGIKSFYEYPTQNNEDSESSSSSEITSEADAPFCDISDYTQLSDNSSDSADNEESSQSTKSSDFQRKMDKHRIERRAKKAAESLQREKRRPSVFPCTIQPLKVAPDCLDVDKWCDDRLKRLKKGNTSTFLESESLTFKYLICHGNGKLPSQEMNFARKRMMIDIMNYKYRSEGKPEQSLVDMGSLNELKSSAQTNGESDISEGSSDEDEGVQRHVRRFRFAGGGAGDDDSCVSDSGSEFDLSDNETALPSPMSNNAQHLTPPSSVESNNNAQSHSNNKSASKVQKLCGAGRIGEPPLNITPSTSNVEPAEESQILSGCARYPLPIYRPNDSELDSPSSRISESDRSARNLDISNFQNVKAVHEHQHLSTLVLEVHCSSTGDLLPNPEYNEIQAIFYGLHNDSPDTESSHNFGYFMIRDPDTESPVWNSNSVEYFKDEASMLRAFILLIHKFDPDILIGFEIQKFSWGYLIERGCKLGLNMMQELSRLTPLPSYKENAQHDSSLDAWNESISGRIVLNLWKLLRHEITTTSYTFESAVFHILHQKVNKLSYQILTNYWSHGGTRLKVIKYFQRRVEYSLKLIEKLDLINRTSELARLFGIQFFEVLSRGSQFRVESMMLRLAKPASLIPPSPNPMQRSQMKAPEYLPLIMEPESKFYTDPVAVLDFQSLYPSMMMAYNYCFSTCIGRVHRLGGEKEFDFGCLSQQIPSSELASLLAEDLLHISPCGVVFVKRQVKRGILGDMLEQILDTRQMVKRAMKKWKDDETLQRVLDSRQLGLKLIANVTYGYTAANYSGRMPCVEIADSVVSKGRETLQRAISYVKENEDIFGGKVVYGDTDSLFVQFPGKTRKEAFELAQKIVDGVTASNPKPVKLKLEKIYQPCILQTKKRYVGFCYESPDQKEPKYDAKGIETVRRDGCPAVAKILEGTLKVLFVTKDGEAVRRFITEQFRKIFIGRVSLNRYTFAREYRGRDGYRPGACVASLEIAKKLIEKDPRAEPLTKERVPYIVVYGTPGSTLISRVRRPEEFIGNPNLRLDSHYYIEKAIIPALNRCLALANMNVLKWYGDMPRRYLKSDYSSETGGHKKGTIDQYFVRENCIKCDAWTPTGFCDRCFANEDQLRFFLRKSKGDIVRKYESCLKTCRNCSGETDMNCTNMTCPVKHKFLRYDIDYQRKLPAVIKLRAKVFGEDDLDW